MKDQTLQKQLLTQTTPTHRRRLSNNTQAQEKAWKKLVITQTSTDTNTGHKHNTDTDTGHKHMTWKF